ncbi:MAG TPA: XRE family transcriptional regulator [Thermomicrobiales bacterium]|jgi:Zn-dependent peptidase ImmA (M78 family)/DNA-binding XRE family transcriptional regulator
MAEPALDSIDAAVIGDRLAAARKARGMTQQQAAEELDLARTTVVAMEKGKRRPKVEELVRFASLYGRQVGEFLRPSPLREPGGFIVQFRSARAPADSPMNDQREADIRQFKDLCERYLELELLTGAPLPGRYPEPHPTDGTDPERAAEEVASADRNRLGLGDGPAGNIWQVLETDVGLRVFAFPFADSRVAGLFAYSEELGGCIAVNANHPEERRRWSAVHEFGHFLTTDRFRAEVQVLPSYRRVPEAERFAEAFARHFLMPAAGLIRRFQTIKRAKSGPVTPADLLNLGQLYGVSFQALVLRLEELKLLPLGTWDRLKDAGFTAKVNEAKQLLAIPPIPDQLQRLPYRYEALAVQAFLDGQISEGRLAQFLGTDRVGARERVEKLTDTRFDENGEIRQVALPLGIPLIGAPT